MTRYELIARCGLLLVWLIIYLIVLNCCFELISASDTLLNIAGALGLVVLVILSVLTRCLTIFIKEKKDD